MAVDETAKAMLATGWWWDGTRMPPDKIRDIEAMAKFWMLKDEITNLLQYQCDVGDYVYAPSDETKNLLAKIGEITEG